MRCTACETAGVRWRDVAGYTLIRCGNATCGHVWVSDPPADDELARFYETSESRFENADAFHRLADYQRNPDAVQRYYHRERIRHLLSRFPDLRPEAAPTVLDVGCASGVFAAVLRDMGLHAFGQDRNGDAVRAGRDALGLRLDDRPLGSCAFGTTFDLVTCYDVIEHTADPVAFLHDVRAHLGPQGRLVVRTPNHAGWLRKVTGRRWLWYIPPAHLHYFTPASLAGVLERAGFTTEAIRTDASTYLYFVLHYLGLTRAGAASLDMPRWKERLVFGLDTLVRTAAYLPLRAAARHHSNPVLEAYARIG